jgi:5,10-methylenetetrahydromethanopterin reductase
MTFSSSAPLRLSLGVLADRSVADTIAQARLADELGFGEVWVAEVNHGRAAFTLAATIAAATSNLDVAIGIVNPFWRHPSVIAMEAATLDEASGGRFRLGIGAAIWSLRALGEADARTEKGYSATVEAVRILRLLLHGEGGVKPSIYAARPDAKLDFELIRPHLPIYLGPVNRRMLQAAGEWADGVELGALMTPNYVTWARGQIAEGARRAGRDPTTLDLAAPLMVSIGDDGRQARELVKRPLAYYLFRVEGVVTELADADPAEVTRVREAVRDEGLEAGARLVTEALIDEFAAAGDPAQVTSQLQRYADAGIRGLIASQVLGPDRLRAIRLLGEEVRPQLVDKS